MSLVASRHVRARLGGVVRAMSRAKLCQPSKLTISVMVNCAHHSGICETHGRDDRRAPNRSNSCRGLHLCHLRAAPLSRHAAPRQPERGHLSPLARRHCGLLGWGPSEGGAHALAACARGHTELPHRAGAHAAGQRVREHAVLPDLLQQGQAARARTELLAAGLGAPGLAARRHEEPRVRGAHALAAGARDDAELLHRGGAHGVGQGVREHGVVPDVLQQG
mmetsp:Transcript_119388/g.385457  ORF Transcript_119388/g.385457 Transcript_119388/m.385457 type:complete len:221 (+) Transcript_119388:1670-2332(+)